MMACSFCHAMHGGRLTQPITSTCPSLDHNIDCNQHTSANNTRKQTQSRCAAQYSKSSLPSRSLCLSPQLRPSLRQRHQHLCRPVPRFLLREKSTTTLLRQPTPSPILPNPSSIGPARSSDAMSFSVRRMTANASRKTLNL